MSFNYHQLEDDSIEHIGSVQEPASNRHRGEGDVEDQTFCPQRPLLPRWPLCHGICGIIIGFICAGLGAFYIFLIPFLIDVHSSWGLNMQNSFGAAIWSGLALIVAGSLAVRATKIRSVYEVHYFYITTAVAFMFNLAMVILIMWSYMQMSYFKDVNKDSLVQKYSSMALVSYAFCVLGCILLGMTTCNYFMAVMFGEVQLIKSFLICCCPCVVPYCKLPPSQASSKQSVDNEEPSMIV